MSSMVAVAAYLMIAATAQAAFIPSTVSVTTTTLPPATLGDSYSATLTAAGGTPPYQWSIPQGSLPAGLVLDTATGMIGGSPSRAGTSTFTAQATDSASPTAASATRTLSITVVVAPLVITTTSLPPGTVGGSYSATLTASGGTPPDRWSLADGSPPLPPGLTLNAGSGAITGTPSRAVSVVIVAMVTDSTSSDVRTTTRRLAITVALPPLTITTTNLPQGTVGGDYRATLAATGGAPPYRWSLLSGSLPAGLDLNPTTGVIAGRPRQIGSDTFGVRVTDSADTDPSTATSTLAITVIVASVNGVGRMVVTPTSVSTSATGPLTFTYTAGQGGLSSGGEIAIAVPPGWAAPSTTPGIPGDVSVRPAGSVSVAAGRLIVVSGITLQPGQTLTVTYGGGSAAIAPGTPGTSTFASSERSGAGATLTSLATGSPSVAVTAAGSLTLLVVLLIIGILVVVVGSILVARRVLHRHRAGPDSRVRAAAHSGPPRSVGVQKVDDQKTVAVHIEPHRSDVTTTVERVGSS